MPIKFAASWADSRVWPTETASARAEHFVLIRAAPVGCVPCQSSCNPLTCQLRIAAPLNELWGAPTRVWEQHYVCVVLGVFAWVVKCRSMILFSFSVNRILYGNQRASEMVISASFRIPPEKVERDSVTRVFCEGIVLSLRTSYLTPCCLGNGLGVKHSCNFSC